MPIRLNLLAEAQSAEEQRRKDPVKRTIILGCVCAGIMALISVAIQAKIMSTNSSASGISSRIQSITNSYAQIVRDEDRLRQFHDNARGLDILASERFLNGTLLNALQQIQADNVQIIRLRTEHKYVPTEEVRGLKTNASKILKPATAAETIQLVIEAVDASANPGGDQMNRFKEAVTRNEHIQNLLGANNEMRLVTLSPPQMSTELARPVVQFTLEGRLPETVRLDISSSVRYAPSTGTMAPAARKPQIQTVNL